jgi:hypothetical protein
MLRCRLISQIMTTNRHFKSTMFQFVGNDYPDPEPCEGTYTFTGTPIKPVSLISSGRQVRQWKRGVHISTLTFFPQHPADPEIAKVPLCTCLALVRLCLNWSTDCQYENKTVCDILFSLYPSGLRKLLGQRTAKCTVSHLIRFLMISDLKGGD